MHKRIEKRYFQLTGDLLNIAQSFVETDIVVYNKKLAAFCSEIETEELLFSGFGTRSVIGFRNTDKQINGTKPCKKMHGYLEPKLTTKAGKILASRMSELSEPCPRKLWQASKLQSFYLIGLVFCSTDFHYYGEFVPTAFIGIPKEIEYSAQPGMQEIKEWEFLKFIDEQEELKKST